APPRGSLEFDRDGEPIYGPKDDVDLAGFRKLGVDFWLAGGFGTKEKLKEALDNGARGIQVGSAFAFCDESGFTTSIKQQVINQVLSEKLTVKTDMKASPTGFPFKVLNVTGTLHDETAYLKRKRVCDLGYLREAYEKADGNIGYRCPSEPVDDYVKKGGKVEDTIGRKCLCNGLVSAIGVAQLRNNEKEGSLITAGNDVVNIKKFIKENQVTYSAKDVLDELLCN
ncbi:MAG TPA: nitronate monooxygenase, partial [Acholeplasma sp.]|nr:nitronate monooxygenase [Acholeplasma sp.]